MSRTAPVRRDRMTGRPTSRAGVAALAALALAGSAVAAGSSAGAVADRADQKAPVTTIRAGLFSPLSLDVTPGGTRYVTQNFAGLLQRQVPGRKPVVLYQSKGGLEVGAVSVRKGKVRFATTGNDGSTFLLGLGKKGKPYRIANLSSFEKRQNPDRGVTYGFRGLPSSCAAQFPAGNPATYAGIVESHPYATAQAAGGTTYVADAAGNTVLAVRKGKVRKVAVLPAAPLKVTASYAEQAKLPSCAVGRTAWFEGVPTDVEVGPKGNLYVSTLPGGPEDGSLGAGASVYKVNPRTGRVSKVAGGLVSATGLAVTPGGSVLVAELFAGRITRILPNGARGTYAEVPFPGDVTWSKRGVFATTNVLSGLSGEPGDNPAGQLVKLTR